MPESRRRSSDSEAGVGLHENGQSAQTSSGRPGPAGDVRAAQARPLGRSLALNQRETIVQAVDAAPATEVPAALLVHGEGFISASIRRLLGGGLAELSISMRAAHTRD